ncbi:hypothetical protein K439DRAFT_1663445 [Ramaria rubella]|nr:hypothetical protein K439DRAFT_1663445 [Ramaria rubella]
MHKRPAALSPPIYRQTKRRRRTATAVLAGYFDHRPERDFFTDMANSNDPHSPYNSILGRGSGILFDFRSQGQKDADLARELSRFQKNTKRKERDIEKRIDKDDQKLKKLQKRIERVPDTFQGNFTHWPEGKIQGATPTTANTNSSSNSSNVNGLPASASRIDIPDAPRRLPAPPPQFHAGPSSWRLPHSHMPLTIDSTSFSEPLPHGTFTLPSADFLRDGSPGATLAPVVPLVTTLGVPPPDLLPDSPPTPSRSISSVTSRTSSKRPHTPDDSDIPLTHMHHDDDTAFEAYSPMDIDQEESILGQDSVSRYKGPIRAPMPSREQSDCRDRTPTRTGIGFSIREPYEAPEWLLLQSPRGDMQSRGTHSWEVPTGSIPSPPNDSSKTSPVQETPTTPSIAHRRSALSLASLLSPSPVLYSPSRPIPPVPSAPETAIPETPQNEPPREKEPTEIIVDSIPEPSVVASTVESSYLSPMAVASPMGGGSLTLTSEAAHVYDPGIISILDGLPLNSADAAEAVEEAPESALRECPPLGPPIELQTPTAVVDLTNQSVQQREREYSVSPEPDIKVRGRASKAILIIHSDDELTDVEDLNVPRVGSKSAKAKSGISRSASKGLTTGDVSASRQTENAGDRPPLDSSASPAVSVVGLTSRGRKRPAAKKGWKGWVEVEIEGDRIPPKHFSLDILPPGERRTRSGRNFDG